MWIRNDGCEWGEALKVNLSKLCTVQCLHWLVKWLPLQLDTFSQVCRGSRYRCGLVIRLLTLLCRNLGAVQGVLTQVYFSYQLLAYSSPFPGIVSLLNLPATSAVRPLPPGSLTTPGGWLCRTPCQAVHLLPVKFAGAAGTFPPSHPCSSRD